jgi:succinate--hydroxymethylglutarate CoA-transferase
LLADKILGRPELANDLRFSTNAARVANRDALVKIISEALCAADRSHWIERFTGLGYVKLQWQGAMS